MLHKKRVGPGWIRGAFVSKETVAPFRAGCACVPSGSEHRTRAPLGSVPSTGCSSGSEFHSVFLSLPHCFFWDGGYMAAAAFLTLPNIWQKNINKGKT